MSSREAYKQLKQETREKLQQLISLQNRLEKKKKLLRKLTIERNVILDVLETRM